MMANSKYASTRETTNLARVARIIKGPCTDVLCAILTKEISPPTLSQKVKAYLSTLPKGKNPPINKEQETIIHNGNYAKFDITLLFFLLRNISNIPPHAKQWGKEPSPSDRSVSANIDRIRLIRNKYVHGPDSSISDIEFKKKIQEISGIIKDLEKYLGTSTIYQDAVIEIKTCSMDPEQESRYIEEFLIVYKKIQDVAEETERFKNSCVPNNLKALYKRDSLKWEDYEGFFLETHNFEVMLEQVRTQPYVTFVGVPGSGKTATARHIALILQKEGYEICPIKEINKIEDYCNPVTPQVFVIDDVLGVFGLNEHKLHMIDNYSERLKDPINPGTKTLMTCREAVFRNEIVSDCILVKKENVVYLHSQENELNDDDKQNLLQNYKLDRDLLNSKKLASLSKMFPFLCKLYSNKKELKDYGSTFFISPVTCIIEDLNSLKKRNKYQYASLVLLMANKNKMSKTILDNENNGTKEKKKREKLFGEMKRNILKNCKVPSTTDNFQLFDALSEMEGTYTKKSGCEFTFIHDSMFEIIAYHFGCQFPELILQYASSNYIANYIKVIKDNNRKRKRGAECEEDKASEDKKLNETNDEIETIVGVSIHLHESHHSMLSARLFKDVQNGEFYNVFGNKALKSPSVLQSFIAILNKKSYDNLYNLLVSELKNSSKVQKWKYEPEKYGDKEKKYRNLRWHAHQFLIDERLIKLRQRSINPNSVRGIKWVIFFGHYQILQYIVNQMIQEKGHVDDLFLNCYNKRHQTYSNINQSETGTDLNSSLNHNMIDESSTKTGNIGENHIRDFEADSDTENSTNNDEDKEQDSVKGSETSFEADSDSSLDSGSDWNTDIDIYNEPVIEEQCRLLCLGCYSGDLNTVKILLKHVNTDALNNKVWSKGCFYSIGSPLVIACYYGYLDIVMELLEAGADVNLCDLIETPLTAACTNGQHSIVRALLNAGASVNEANGVCKPLQCACKEGHIIIVEELINAGANVNLKVPLISACKEGHLRIVKKLIKAGADINLKDYVESPLLAACTNGHISVVKELISAGVDVNVTVGEKSPLTAAYDGGYFNIMKLLMKSGAKIDLKDKSKSTLPCYWDNLNIVNRLIEMESNVGLNNTNEMLLLAACDRGHLEEVKELIKGGADVNIIIGDKTPLIVACYKNHLHIVHELIETGADVNLRTEFISPLLAACYEGNSSIVKVLKKARFNGNPIYSDEKALIGACFFGHLSVVKELVACCVKVNQKYGKETPLTSASYMGHLHIVKELIRAGADVNQNDGDKTPLTAACYRGNVNIVTELIKEGADINLTDYKNTPLTASCYHGSYLTVKELIKYGADVNLPDSNITPPTTTHGERNRFFSQELKKAEANVNLPDGNKTPLQIAFEQQDIYLVEKLIKAGADFNFENRYTALASIDYNEGFDYSQVIKVLVKRGTYINDRFGDKTPLTAACDRGLWLAVQRLIKAGAEVNQSDEKNTPLTVACERGFLNIVKALIYVGADVNKSDGNKTPLTAAYEGRHFDVAEELIYAGADINKSDGNKTPLTAACEKGHWEEVEALIFVGADVNKSDGNKTPLTAACEGDHLISVFDLIDAGADVNQSDGNKTPLTAACERGHVDVVKALIFEGADVNKSDENKTPLTAACEGDHWVVVSELIKAGADVNQSDGNKTPLTAACERGHWEVVQQLIKAGSDVNQSDGNKTPLIAACKTGQWIVVQELISANVDVNQSDGKETPLIAACGSDFPLGLVVRDIINAGADVNFSNEQITPIEAAFNKNNWDAINELKEAGVNISIDCLQNNAFTCT